MITQSLGGTWKFRRFGASDWHPASVPGSVYTDLLANGDIPNPFIGENEEVLKWIAKEDWEYKCEFSPEAALLHQERVELVCYGLDTLAELSFNNQPIGRTDNMFRQYSWDVGKYLIDGENTISILFRSPLTYIKSCQKARHLPAIMNGGIAYLRKAQCHFGWDWAPRLPNIGIWREICLKGYSIGRLVGIHVRQKHESGHVTLYIMVENERWNERDLNISLTIKDLYGEIIKVRVPMEERSATLEVPIPNPRLWWPIGLGNPHLYKVEVALLNAECLIDYHSFQIGLRTIDLCQDVDKWGRSFTFKVNSVPIFAKGANWIPADCFPSRLTGEKLDQLVQSAAMANMNMLRVWGGGYYEDEHFYDACDRLGILVWQDFMFASAAYPLDENTFRKNVVSEVIENIRRLRHRACLALWCGNNDIEFLGILWRSHTSLTRAFEDFFYHQLPEIVRTNDPDHPYWPSSPSSGVFMKNSNGEASGDVHLWQVWHGLRPITYFRTRFPRFISEFGVEALPTINTITSFVKPQDLDLKSDVMLHHQRSTSGNRKMVYYLTTRFRLPREFSDLVYLTQVMQAEAIRIGVEHWRRNRQRCSGALFWQFNDCWPAISWSSIDYEGRWKVLQYAARRFFAPIALSLENIDGQVGIYISNDTALHWQGRVYWTLETLAGLHIDSGHYPAASGPLTTTCLGTHDFDIHIRKHGRTALVFTAELWHENERIAIKVLTFAPEKEMILPDPGLVTNTNLEDNLLTITISVERLARFMALSLIGADVIFSDNYFDLPAGRTMQVTCPLPKGWNLEQARNSLCIHSLADVVSDGSIFFDNVQHILAGLDPISFLRRIFETLLSYNFSREE